MSKNKLAFIVTLCVIAAIWISLFLLKKTDHSDVAVQCDLKISSFLAENGIDPEKPLTAEKSPVESFRKKSVLIQKEFNIPFTASLDDLKDSFVNDIDLWPIQISKIQKLKRTNKTSLILEFEFEKLLVYRLTLNQKPHKGKIALVIDDWGYSKNVLDKAVKIDAPITYAILPKLAYSGLTAQTANEKGHEIILHLPLEPHNSQNIALEKNTIMTTMSEPEINEIVKDDIKDFPVLHGINNHMGSKATEDGNVMGIIFDIAKQNNLYFLDSYTSKESILMDLALNKDISFLKRDVFLDDKDDEAEIKAQLIKTKQIAEKTGQVIAIGHARPLTIDVLIEMIPPMQREGYKFVYLSELLPPEKK